MTTSVLLLRLHRHFRFDLNDRFDMAVATAAAFTIHFGHSVCEPIFGRAALGLAACSAFAYRPEIDNFSHVATLGSGFVNSSP
jgi:hypothetical protein